MGNPCCPDSPSKVTVRVVANYPQCENLNTQYQLNWSDKYGSWGGKQEAKDNTPEGYTFDFKCKGFDSFGNPVFQLTWSLPNCGGDAPLSQSVQCSPSLDVLMEPTGVSNLGCCSGANPPSSGLVMGVDAGVPYPDAKPPSVPPCNPAIECCPRTKGGNGPGGGDGGGSGSGPGGGPPGNPPTCTRYTCTQTGYSTAPVRYGTGEFDYWVTDISVKGYGVPWGHTRSFRPRLNHSETIGQGYNWQVKEWPFLVQGPSGLAGTEITEVVIQGESGSSYWFDKVDGEWVPRFNVKSTLEHDTVNNVYRLTDLKGNTTEFDDYTGMFYRRISPAGNTITVTGMSSNGSNFTTVEREYTENSITTTEKFEYAYQDVGDLLLSSVTLSRKVGAGSWKNISRALYSYYGANEPYGLEEDLKTATTQQWDGSAWQDTGTNYYRYHKTLTSGSSSSSSSSSSGGENGFAHQLKYILNKEAYNKLAADPNVSDPLTATDAQVAQYADFYYEFDEQRRVTKEMIQGGSRTFTFSYEESSFDDDYNTWKTKTTETLPDGSQNIVYCNYASQPMLKILKSGDDEWYEFFKFDDSANVILYASSSAISGYDDQYADLLHEVSGNYQYLRDSSGLIRTYTYHAPTNWLASSSIQEGELGTSIKLLEKEYISCGSKSSSSSSSSFPAGGLAYFLSKEISYPSDTDQTKKIITSYSYTWYDGTCQVEEKTTTLPVISTSQNGSGTANTCKEYFDEYGYLIWKMDERGYINRTIYNVPKGKIIQRVFDVDTGQATGVPVGWTTPSGGGLNLIQDLEQDEQGRLVQALGPVHTIDINGTATEIRTANWFVYKNDSEENQTWHAKGYVTGTAPNYSYTLINPVNILKKDKNGNLIEKIQATRASISGKLLPTDSFAQSTYVSWTTNQYTECCLLESTRRYHTIPTSGSGSSGTNYDQTDYGYDSMKRRNRTVTPGGTISFNVLDVRENVIKSFVGTDDTGATNQDPTGGGFSENNMVQVTELEYDGGSDGGDNNLTKQTQYVTASDSRVTLFSYDWRNRRIESDGEVNYFQKLYYDNLEQITKTERYDTSSVGNLIARSETLFDDLGRVYQTIVYGVDPSTGTVGNSLVDNVWYDPTGNKIKELPAGSGLFKKNVYDSLGRHTVTYQAYDLDESNYEDAGTVTGDTVIEQTEITYDDASNIIQTVTRQRYHDAPASQTGALQNPSTTPKARVTYQANYPDAVRRIVATADYGTNGGSTLTRSSTIPVSSENVLVTLETYDSAGRKFQMTDPAGKIDQIEYDARGRNIKRMMNVQQSSSSSSSSECPDSLDKNITVLTTYNADGNISSLIANNSLTGNQTSTYTYGTTLSDSEIATSILKRSETYPDSVDSSDRISFKYNRQSQISEVQDQGNTVHSFDFDKLGRQTQDRITTLGTGVDGAIRRIETTYEVRGMKEALTSYDIATVDSGTIVNEVRFSYNDFGQLISDYQSHSGAVNTSTTPKVQYGFVNGSDNTIRRTSLTYPDGRVLNYDYGTAEEINDSISRIASLVDDDMSFTHLADYGHLGLNKFVKVDYTEPEVEYTLIGTAGGNDPDTGDIYRGLDRFGRIKDSYWHDYSSFTDVDRILYGYNRIDNRTYRENVVAEALSEHFDELYEYDGINRLKDMNRGTLNVSKDTITNLQFAECWALDETGNWSSFRQDDTGNGTWDLNQFRTDNTVNEITDITESVGSSWVTPTYNEAGNMTTIPQPVDPTTSFTATYDAWGRLVKIVDGSNTVAEYDYDGVKRRVTQKIYIGGSLSETRHLYYTEPNQWQVIEERVDSSGDPSRQFVWGVRYQDELVLRDRDTTTNGTLDERLYGLQDANWNISSVINMAGSVQERFTYNAYGKPAFLSSSFTSQSSSTVDWETLYCGYRFDATTELFHIRNRTYLFNVGEWLSRDPLDYLDGMNLYAYVGNNPINKRDPLGLAQKPPGFHQCVADCQDDCAERFTPNWWNPSYVGCISGCNPGCENKDWTICGYLNELPECSKDVVGCICSISGWIDVAAPPLPPLVALDCICEALSITQLGCTGGFKGANLGWLNLADCLGDIADASGILKADGFLEKFALFLGDFSIEALEELALDSQDKSGLESCFDIPCSCFS